MIIEHDNIIYMSDIPNVGGTSTYVLELAKRYQERDIAVVYKTCQSEMIFKIVKYCKVYKLHSDDLIKCKAIIINHDSSVCKQIIEGKIYMTLHADYSNYIYNGKHPRFDEKIDEYISINKNIQKWLKDKCNKDSQLIYNPLSVEDNKPIVLMSATRMSKEKGRNRTIALADALDSLKINYIWLIFTPNDDDINKPNVIYMKSRTDLDKFFWMADYGVQLSDSEGLSYTINEFLYRNIPVIVTPLPYLEEIGVKDGVNSYIIDFDCKNVYDIAKKIKNIPKFTFQKLNDSYDDILVEGVSKYEKERNNVKKVVAIKTFDDIVDKERRKVGDKFIVSNERAEDLIQKRFVRIIEDIPEPVEKKPKANEPIVEEAIKDEPKENTKRVRRVAKK